MSNYPRDRLDMNFNDTLDLLNLPDSSLRVRVHATHSFSGPGGTFQSEFVARNNNYFVNGFKLKI